MPRCSETPITESVKLDDDLTNLGYKCDTAAGLALFPRLTVFGRNQAETPGDYHASTQVPPGYALTEAIPEATVGEWVMRVSCRHILSNSIEFCRISWGPDA